jgi:hypothetical protein
MYLGHYRRCPCGRRFGYLRRFRRCRSGFGNNERNRNGALPIDHHVFLGIADEEAAERVITHG